MKRAQSNRGRARTCQKNGGEVKYRFYENAGMGCVNISDKSQLMEDLGYRPWVHFVPFPEEFLDGELWPDVDCLAALIRKLSSPSERMEIKHISDSAFKFTAENHTYLERAQKVITDLEI